jgi:hypothetical protein
MLTELPLGLITQREERLKKEKKCKMFKSKFIRICLKESFHREKKDWEQHFLCFYAD